MEQLSPIIILLAAVAFIIRDLLIKLLWSVILFATRGEFNLDNDWKTADEFDHFSPDLGTFQRRYITKYTLLGVHWGFFTTEGYVKGFSFWADWAADRGNRFRVPIKINSQDEKEFLTYIMRKM